MTFQIVSRGGPLERPRPPPSLGGRRKGLLHKGEGRIFWIDRGGLGQDQYTLSSIGMEGSMETIKADRELNCCGLLCPVPVIETTKAIKQMEVGQVLKMVATDPGSMPDMRAWSRQTGHEMLSATEENKIFTFYFRRTK